MTPELLTDILAQLTRIADSLDELKQLKPQAPRATGNASTSGFKFTVDSRFVWAEDCSNPYQRGVSFELFKAMRDRTEPWGRGDAEATVKALLEGGTVTSTRTPEDLAYMWVRDLAWRGCIRMAEVGETAPQGNAEPQPVAEVGEDVAPAADGPATAELKRFLNDPDVGEAATEEQPVEQAQDEQREEDDVRFVLTRSANPFRATSLKKTLYGHLSKINRPFGWEDVRSLGERLDGFTSASAVEIFREEILGTHAEPRT